MFICFYSYSNTFSIWDLSLDLMGNINVNIYVYICTFMHIYVHVYICTCMYMYIYIYIYMHIWYFLNRVEMGGAERSGTKEVLMRENGF
jgi:hypothetical protein